MVAQQKSRILGADSCRQTHQGVSALTELGLSFVVIQGVMLAVQRRRPRSGTKAVAIPRLSAAPVRPCTQPSSFKWRSWPHVPSLITIQATHQKLARSPCQHPRGPYSGILLGPQTL